MEFVDTHREQHGVEPIIAALAGSAASIAPSTYYAHKNATPSARAVSDAATLATIRTIHRENYGVYGVRKVWHELRRQGHDTARCTVERLMRGDGLRGISRANGPRTTVPGPVADRPADLVDRQFHPVAANTLWVADIVRHEALFDRVEVRDRHRPAVAAAG